MWSRRVIQYQAVSGPILVEVVPNAEASGGSADPSVGTIPIWQYQALAGPVANPAPAEVQGLDKWTPQYPVFNWRARRLTDVPSERMPVFVPDVTSPVTAGSWKTTYPDRVPGKQRTPWFQPIDERSLFAGETLSQISWASQATANLSRRPSVSHRLWGQSHYAVIVSVPVMSWTGRTLAEPVVRVPRRTLTGGSAWTTDAPAPPAAPDLTFVTYQSRLYGKAGLAAAQQRAFHDDLSVYPFVMQHWQEPTVPAWIGRQSRRYQEAAQGAIFVPDVTTAPGLSWAATYPDRVLATQRLREYPSVASAFQSEAFSDIGWLMRFPAPVRRGPWSMPSSLSQAIEGADVPILSWVGSWPDQVARRRWEVGPATCPVVYVPDVTDPVTGLAWAATYPHRLPAAVRAATYPSGPVNPWVVPDLTDPAPALSWRGVQPSALDRARRLVTASQQAFWTDPQWTAPAAVTVPEYSWAVHQAHVVLRRLLRMSTEESAPLYVPDVTAEVPPSGITPVYPDIVLAKAGLRPGVRPTLMQPALVADTWWQPVTVDYVPRYRRIVAANEPRDILILPPQIVFDPADQAASYLSSTLYVPRRVVSVAAAQVIAGFIWKWPRLVLVRTEAVGRTAMVDEAVTYTTMADETEQSQ